jgi:N-acetylneuraminic acid mutarotase
MRWIAMLSILITVMGLAMAQSGVGQAGPIAIGLWQTTGSLTPERMGHTATLLPSGQVLVAGGGGCISLVAPGWYCTSAELYNPAPGRWGPTGSLSAARIGHTATLLGNGKLLVAGGFGCQDEPVCASAELYDPATGRWATTGRMATGRFFHTATLLPNGRVLVVGGIFCSAGACPSAELYDPATGRWQETGSLHQARFFHTATLLPNGQVLVAGGEGCPPSHLCASAELYEPATGTWRETGRMTVGREEHTATLLPDGQVLVAGGYGCLPSNVCASAEVYNPATGTWKPTGSMAHARAGHTATLLPDGEILVAGGYGCAGQVCHHLASAELYDPATGTWGAAGSMHRAREYQTATLLVNGTVLLAGGSTGCFVHAGCIASPSAEVYVPRQGRSRSQPSKPVRVQSAHSGPGLRCPSTPIGLGPPPRPHGITGIWLQAQPASSGMVGYLASDRLNRTNGWMPDGSTGKIIWLDDTGQPVRDMTMRDLALGPRAPRLPFDNGIPVFPRPGCWQVTLRSGRAVGHVTMLVLGD